MSESENKPPSEDKSQPDVKIFSLSTCSHCKAAKKFIGECTIKYDFVDVDMLEGDERKANPYDHQTHADRTTRAEGE